MDRAAEMRLRHEANRRFRVSSLQGPLGPWRRLQRDALLDALRLGHASRYRCGTIYVTTPAYIQAADRTPAIDEEMREHEEPTRSRIEVRVLTRHAQL